MTHPLDTVKVYSAFSIETLLEKSLDVVLYQYMLDGYADRETIKYVMFVSTFRTGKGNMLLSHNPVNRFAEILVEAFKTGNIDEDYLQSFVEIINIHLFNKIEFEYKWDEILCDLYTDMKYTIDKHIEDTIGGDPQTRLDVLHNIKYELLGTEGTPYIRGYFNGFNSNNNHSINS